MSTGHIEHALDAVWARTRGARNRRRIHEELADHLHEAAIAERAHGTTPDDAERRAVERLGDTKTIAAAFPPSRWRVGAAVSAVAATGALAYAEVATHEASVRTCLGGRCPDWIPRAPQHPIQERVELLTAGAAAALALIMAIGAFLRWRSGTHAYEAAVERRTAAPSPLTTRTLLAESLHGPIRLAAVGLAVMTIAGAGLAARWQTETPSSPQVVALRPAALTIHPTTIDGLPRARPLLRHILSQLPGEFTSVGVHPGRGLVIQTPGTSDPYAHASDPNQVVRGVEISALEEAFVAQQTRFGLHVIHFYLTDTYPDDAQGGRFGRTPVLPVPTPIPHLRERIASRLHRQRLRVTRLAITHPYGPFVVAVARTDNPRRYIERSPGLLSRHITWGLLVIRDQNGITRAIYVTQGHARHVDVGWYDPRLFPAQPDHYRGYLPPPPPPPHAPPLRTARG
jgi:hypothetical protein